MNIHFLNILATWRLTELLVEERGFYAIFDKVREYVHSKSQESYTVSYGRVNPIENEFNMPKEGVWLEISKMLECRYCTSVTVGLALAIVTRQNVLYGFAYSAGSLMFGRLFERIEE